MNAFYLRVSGFVFLLSCSLTAQSQWEHLPGPFGAEVRQFDQDGDRLYALTAGGIYESADAAGHWTLLEYTLFATADAKQFQVENGQIYLLGSDSTLLRSADRGAHWTAIFQRPFPYNGPGEKLRCIFASGDTVLIGSALTIYHSYDRGNTWQASEIFANQRFTGFARIGQDLYAALDWLIRKSSDGGQSWKTVYSSGYFFAGMTVLDTTLFAMYDGYSRLVWTTNGGASWKKSDADLIKEDFGPIAEINGLAGEGDNLYFVTRPYHYGSDCDQVLYVSNDRGIHWHQAESPLAEINRLITYSAFSGLLLLGGSDGVWRSTNGGADMDTSSTGISSTVVPRLIKTGGTRWWAHTNSGIFISADDGETWIQRFPERDYSLCGNHFPIFQTRKRLFHFQEPNSVLFSSDNGDTWDTLHFDSSPGYSNIMTSENSAFFYGYDNIFRLADDQNAPQKFEMPDVGPYANFQAQGTNVFYSGPSRKMLSRNEGKSWIEISSPPISYYDQTLEDDYLLNWNYWNSDSVYILDLNRMKWQAYKPVDAVTGIPLTRYRFLLEKNHLRWAEVEDKGLYYSSVYQPDLWYLYDPTLPKGTTLCLAIEDDEIWTGTLNAGIFRTRLDVKMPGDEESTLSLFPNPSTGAGLQLVSDLFFPLPIGLHVFDAAGRLVHDERLNPGQHWTLDLSALPPGMYFLLVQTGEHKAALKWVKPHNGY